MYLVTLDATTGTLAGLRLVPLQARRLQLVRASMPDRDWMHETLARVSRPFGTHFQCGDEGDLVVVVPTPRAALEVPPRTVASVMTAPVETIDAGETVAVAARRLRNANVGMLPVLDRGTLAGVVTDRDLVVRVVADARDPQTTAVRDVMTEGVAICSADDTLPTASAIMVRKAVRRLVVLNADGSLAGVVSVDDLATVAADEGEGAPIGAAEPAHPIID
jgi:CBS domain-containing protein